MKFIRDYIPIIISLSILIIFIIIFGISNSTAIVGLLGVFLGSVISSFTNIILSKQKFRQQLSIASLDRKLATHQKAFSIWWNIRSNVHNKDTIWDIVIEAQKWWKAK